MGRPEDRWPPDPWRWPPDEPLPAGFFDDVGRAAILQSKYRGLPSGEAADVQQETVLALYSDHPPPGSYAEFTCRASRHAENAARRFRRRRDKCQPLLADVALPGVDDSREWVEAVKEFVELLPDSLAKRVFIARVFERKSYPRVAEQLGLTVSSAYHEMNRAVARLRAQLAKLHPEEAGT